VAEPVYNREFPAPKLEKFGAEPGRPIVVYGERGEDFIALQVKFPISLPDNKSAQGFIHSIAEQLAAAFNDG